MNLKQVILIIYFWFSGLIINAQCVNAYPFTENFEVNNGSWISGGFASDWEWGSPSKSVINRAGSGLNCWTVGGLSGSYYNDGENSWVQSPCFNFTNLVIPQVSFKVFWESEQRFDGAALQYSLDAGATWQLIGTAASVNNCNGINWYNTGSVTYLGNTAGWSGNIQPTSGACLGGNGSGKWVIARHKVPELGGKSEVIFRFVFGAGTQCNGYNGFAFDDFDIRELPSTTGDFIFSCQNNRSVQFESEPTYCQQNIAWNFGDPSSGTNNFSNDVNPTHVFTAPGQYEVVLTYNTTNAGSFEVRKYVTVVDASINIVSAVKCTDQANGVVNVQVQPVGNYFYQWNNNPALNTAEINNLPAGNYTVQVSSSSACTVTASIELVNPGQIRINPIVTNSLCLAESGSIILSTSGGTLPYTYSWSNGATTENLNNLAAGSYVVAINDANGCLLQSGNLVVNTVNQTLPVSIGANKYICPGDSVILSPGLFSSYLWQDNSVNSTYIVKNTGNYSVIVTDQNGCEGSAAVTITVECNRIWFPSALVPEGLEVNRKFGALGNSFAAITEFQLEVYNRSGVRVFFTRDPATKWDGTYKGKKLDAQVFVWQARYKYRGFPQFDKGTLILLK